MAAWPLGLWTEGGPKAMKPIFAVAARAADAARATASANAVRRSPAAISVAQSPP
jgi:hypothetical protein